MGGTTNVETKPAEKTAEATGTASVAAAMTVTPAPKPAEQVPQQITYDQFRAVEMLVGEVKAVEPVPNADKLLKLFVDFGARGSKVVLAGIAKTLADPPGVNDGGIQKIVGKRLAFVFNLEPRKMKGIESQAMLLAATSATDPERVSFVEVPGAKVGARLS